MSWIVETRIIPAYAGSTPSPRSSKVRFWDHPRIRGEHVSGFDAEGGPKRIIPAYAGSTSSGPGSRTRPGDHPRIRGEHVRFSPPTAPPMGSSPHTRGARGGVLVHLPDAGIIPAYAGSTTASPRRASRSPDHPRIRGEHRRVARAGCRAVRSSPHTRGAPAARPTPRKPARIIPAYAGSTCRRRPRSRRLWDHPRIRGEHRRFRRPGRQDERIIPAYAGSTWRCQ